MKRTFLFLTALCLALSVWADKVIIYTATSKLEETMDQNTGGLFISGFGSPMVSHTFSDGLGTITFQNEITNIKYRSFYKCTELISIIIPTSVTTMGDDVFEGCTNILSVVWNARNCTYTQSSSPFYASRTKITDFSFGDQVESVPAHLCQGMTSLTKVTIPKTVTHIGESAFEGSRNITSVKWNASNCTYTQSSSPFYSARYAITSFAFGTEVQTIPGHLCDGLVKLTSVTIPASVTTLGASVFYGSTEIKSVTWNARNCTYSQDSSPFYSARSSITSFTFGPEVQNIPRYMCDNLTAMTSVSLTNSIQTIGEHAFSECCNLTSIDLPSSLTEIGASAFSECTSLTKIAIPRGVKHINNRTFEYCKSLTSINLREVETIAPLAFYFCTGLTTLTVPETLTQMANDALSRCSSLNKVVWEAIHYTSSGSPLGEVKRQITDMVFGNRVETIPAGLCEGMDTLSAVVILGQSLTSIGDRAFSGCFEMTDLTLPASLQTIGSQAFKSCSGLQVLSCEAINPPSAADDTFKNIYAKIPVHIPAGTKSAYESAEGWSHFRNFQDPAEPDAIESVETTPADTKTIRNGQVVILRGDKMYDMLGNEVR